jgi:pimeloyl-ACP methyl ester carboxylesterase
MRPTPGDHTMNLPDGRTIAFAVYGDAEGAPVLNCHGGLVSGHDVGPADQMARSRGVCVISPDRPGIHGTDRLPGHGLLPWVRSDLEPLLEHLEVDTVGVMGWSEGGQYALATAYALSGRVTRCAVIAGCPPLDDPATFKRLNGTDHALAVLARRAPFVVRAIATGSRQLAKHRPTVLLSTAVRGAPNAEATRVREQGLWLPTILGEGAANARGVVDEYRALVAPWGFEPEDVSTAVRIYQGTADPLVPESWARELTDRIPGASLALFPTEGHFIALTRRKDVLDWLTADPSTNP